MGGDGSTRLLAGSCKMLDTQNSGSISHVTITKLSNEYDDFEVKIDRIHPRYDETLASPLLDKDGRPV
jgi:hypothetical protein